MKRHAFLSMMVVLGLGLLLGFLVAGSPPSPVSLAAPAATTRHVIPGGYTTGDCDDVNWANACELQYALSVAVTGDEIWVAAGTYTPTQESSPPDSRTATFQLVSGVEIYGGFAATETLRTQRDWAAHVTILSGDLAGDDGADFANYGENSYHVVTAGSGVTATAVLDGFTISGGNANGGEHPHWDGGGMYNSGSSPTLSNCAFVGNLGNHGSGMYNDAGSSPALTNVVFFSNTASSAGGGMSNNNSSPTLTNVTFSDNHAGNWGGGVYNWQSSPALRNCILWSNTATSGGNQMWDASSTPVVSYSLVQGGYTGVGNIDADPLFVDAAAGDLHLGLDSPAVDTGNNDDVTVATDLDGNPRFGLTGRVDMGAYEFQYPAPPGTIHVDGAATPGAGDGSDWPEALTSLRFALAWAGVGLSDYGLTGVEIRVAEGTYKPHPGADREATFQLHSGVAVYGGFPVGGGSWGIRDWQTYTTTLSGDLFGNDGPDFANHDENSYHVVTGSGVTETAVVDGFTISGGNANGGAWPHWDGGGMYNSGSSPTLSNCAFIGNLGNHGSGMYNNDASFPVLTHCIFANNQADVDGGGMFNYASSPVLTNVSFFSNTATSDGGGMFNNDHSSPALTNVSFFSNTATSNGGGMYNGNGSSPALTDCQFTNNAGGGMYNYHSSPTLSNVTFEGNGGGQDGGGMCNYTSSPTLTKVTFERNGAVGGGGMFNGLNSSPLLTDVSFSENQAGYLGGGGMRNDADSGPTLINCEFNGNTAFWAGGGMLNEGNSNPKLTDVIFSGNGGTGLWYGGGMYNWQSSPELTHVTFISNTASRNGGGMYNTGGSSPALTHASFISNTADYGGGMYNTGISSLTLTHASFVSNSATYDGGGLYNQASAPALNGVTLTLNTAQNGGGMYNEASSPTLTQASFVSNTATYDGGGMYNDGGAPALSAVTLTLNIAQNGGGMYNNNSSPAAKRITFTHNTATMSGGGMYNQASSPVLASASLISNTAVISGGGMYNDSSSPILSYFAFIGNAAGGHGGGIHNDGSDATLVIGILTGNRADANDESDGLGGGIYNLDSSPDLINVTLSGNSAQYGGGMANLQDTTPSLPALKNTIVWGNTADGGSPQIYDEELSQAMGSACMVEGGYGTCFVQDTDSPFVDADGPDNVPGTTDDDLRLAGTSHAIDAGDKDHLPADGADLDGDGDSTEKLPYDLAGEPRCYADQDPLDGTVDGDPDNQTPDPEPCEINDVDLGAYEAGCPGWHLHYGAEWLTEGQDYRLGFHHVIAEPSSVTISHTLASYAAERAAGNLADAKTAYGFALDCATTVSETNEALAGLLKVTWEQATGALLEGNEEMVKALDLSDGQGMAMEISYLQTAIDKYTEATDGYLLPLSGEHQGDFLAALGISRTHQLTYTTAITQVDVQRLAAASAKKSRATLELAERQFRDGDRALAGETLRQGKAAGAVELVLLYTLWTGVVEDVNYHALLRCLSDMDRLFGFLVEDRNPLGYSPEWIPIHYRPGIDENNYEPTDALALTVLDQADAAIQDAAEESQDVHDEYEVMQQRYWDIEAEYDGQLVTLCGADLEVCDEGTIAEQISAVEQAQLRLGRVLEEMNVLSKRIQIEVEARAKTAGIYDATAELIGTDGETYSSMVEQEEEISTGWKVFKGVAGILAHSALGAKGGVKFGKKGAIAGGALGCVGAAIDVVAGLVGPEEGPPKEEKLLEYQAWQNAQMLICDGQIADVEFEKRIKELFLEYGPLDIDYAIALENLHEELLRLDGMKTRVEYLLAEKARALAFTTLLYRDPAHRVLRDKYMELAQDSYDTALDFTFQAGRALEYEANLTSGELGSPDPDGMFGIRDIADLRSDRNQTWLSWVTWKGDKQLQPETTVVRLSQALNYTDTGTATAEEQFNAYVIRNPDNRFIEPTGEESLFFAFDTSIHMGNPFFWHCLFNDRIETVQVRIRGADLGLDHPEDGVRVALGWGDVSCAGADCGTTLIRSEEAWYTDDGYGNKLDDLRAYAIQPKVAQIQAAVGDEDFPDSPNTDLALRSVACPYWTFYIPGNAPGNEGLNLDNVDEIELTIYHKAYSSQAPMCQGPGSRTPAPSRPYRPMERVLDPMSSPLLAALAEDRGPSAGDADTSLSGLYAGTVAITSPQYMPALDLNLVLTATDGSLTGYLDAAQSLHVPVVDEATEHGPAVSGSWSGETFSLQSEPFTTTLGLGLTVTRQVILHSGVISNSGEYLTGLYSETVAGLTPQPMVIYGDVELWRLPAAVAPSASFSAFPLAGPVALTVTFSDFSTGDPDGWLWDFGDGGSSTEQNPTHTYTATGTYTVTLTVSNTLGADMVVMPGYITVVDKPRIYLPLVMRPAP